MFHRQLRKNRNGRNNVQVRNGQGSQHGVGKSAERDLVSQVVVA